VFEAPPNAMTKVPMIAMMKPPMALESAFICPA
jgi:hypothetical protein